MHPSVASSTSNVVLEYIKRNSHGHNLLHLVQDLELMGAFLPFPTQCHGSAVKIADNCWQLLVNIIIDNRPWYIKLLSMI